MSSGWPVPQLDGDVPDGPDDSNAAEGGSFSRALSDARFGDEACRAEVGLARLRTFIGAPTGAAPGRRSRLDRRHAMRDNCRWSVGLFWFRSRPLPGVRPHGKHRCRA